MSKSITMILSAILTYLNSHDALVILLALLACGILKWRNQAAVLGSGRDRDSWTRVPLRQPQELTKERVQPGKQLEEGLPDPDPLLDFDLSTARTRDYVYVNRTLRYPYFQTMSHRPMHINDWIEIDKDFVAYLDQKKRVIEEHAPDVLLSLPENDDACTELLQMLADYLPRRYPTLFARLPPTASPTSGTDKPFGGGILNKATGEQFDVTSVCGTDALRIVSRLVQDDFLMGRERDDGKIYLVGGLVAFPGFYLLSEKLGQPLSELHAPVPHFAAKIGMSVERTLVRLDPAHPFERSSWGIADDQDMFWHNITSNPLRPGQRAEDLWLRICHQTFRKLPRSRVIVFGVHPVLRQMKEFADLPLVPELLAKIHVDSSQEMLDYKQGPKYIDVLVPYLQQLAAQQVERGLVRPDEREDPANFRRLAQDRCDATG
ncbi:hypothetical protein OBBRIDRAFT_793135 [Obba rivulosa]|uniref:Uncharacterized protein n=1 Tax=Obba rivulosa TaxID=1052685 RepID=A0A8E2DNN4_9APHY|nr:hypothetical protein OBBRIDRAFT_793135 [Obba rivulosa]